MTFSDGIAGLFGPDGPIPIALAISTFIGPALISIAVASLGVTLAVAWVRRIRSAV